MNNKRLISLTICWILLIVSRLYVSSFAGTNTETGQHYEKANELHKLADYDGAIAEFEAVISLSPKSAIAQNAQYWIGQIYFETGRFDAALSIFEKLVNEFPTSVVVPTTKIMIERAKQTKKDRSLIEAVKKGELEQVEKLISEGADVNARDEQFQNSLNFAARYGHEDIARLLISKGADVNMNVSEDSWTPLFDAVGNGHTKLVELLLEKGAKVDMGHGSGYTPLYPALWNEDEETVRMLISVGVDVNKGPNKDVDDPPLFYAAWQCHAVVKALIDAGADVNAEGLGNGWTPLRHALQWAYADVAKKFIGTGVKIPALHNAVLEGDLAEVRKIVESGTDVDTKDKFGWTPAYWALSAGQKNIAEYLLNKGADVTAKTNDGCTLLHQACKAGFMEIAGQLIAKGVDVNAATKTGRQPLADAASYGHKEIVKLLVAKGANVNAMFDRGRHALGNAVEAGHEEIVKLLIDSGAEVNLHSESRGAALHAASRNGHSTILDLLIANGADVNLNAIRGTPLHRAAFSLPRVEEDVSVEIIEKLLTKGADVNAKDPSQGRTPLHQAAFRGRYKSVERLITAGADLNAEDNEGRTPSDLAEQRGHTEIVELLKKHGAKE